MQPLRLFKHKALSYLKKPVEKIKPAVEIVCENYFQTRYEKNALLSYVIYPFIGPIENNHSNNRECFTLAEILSELGYNVDIINWNNTSFVPVRVYDIVIDNHDNLNRLAPFFDSRTKKIFHATNAHWLYQNAIEYQRHWDYFVNSGVSIVPPRLVSAANSSTYADFISMFGNGFTRKTYGDIEYKVYHLPMSVSSTPELLSRDFSKARKRAIWLNSHGALLKGLDIAIEAFLNIPEAELLVCGDLEKDQVFFHSIKQKLLNAPNIQLLGWQNLDSIEFKQLASSCAWIINTSFSEGGGGSTLNCMAKGLIPVISRSASITLPEETGFYIEQNDAEHLTSLINEVSKLSEQSMELMSRNSYDFIKKNHTLENFRARYKDFLIKVIE